ncbi:hypothetical protein BJ170DRAFT_599581 [Xylariales sp. AK1849]|nr:hypothetical protein BJ170DRAFT_599581 [Xylariales sp. AK1849]
MVHCLGSFACIQSLPLALTKLPAAACSMRITGIVGSMKLHYLPFDFQLSASRTPSNLIGLEREKQAWLHSACFFSFFAVGIVWIFLPSHALSFTDVQTGKWIVSWHPLRCTSLDPVLHRCCEALGYRNQTNPFPAVSHTGRYRPRIRVDYRRILQAWAHDNAHLVQQKKKIPVQLEESEMGIFRGLQCSQFLSAEATNQAYVPKYHR